MALLRSKSQKIIDFITFPIRAVTIFQDNKWGLSSLRSERFEYSAREVKGHCLDVGCGKHNLFINDYLQGKGIGIDVYKYDGLTDEHIVNDITHFPYENNTFESVTFIANINHVPRPKRDVELAEAYRCLKTGGNIIITMGNPLAEILVHKVVFVYGKLFGAHHDMDTERGMEEGEEYYLTDTEIISRMKMAGFKNIEKKYFATQWALNALFVGTKI
ncbi:MAG: methyltransferase domain-containing protein [Bacteroidia bacterium]